MVTPRLLPLLVLVQAAWFLVPGLVAAVWLCRRGLVPARYVVIVSGVVGAVLAYLGVWVYLAGGDVVGRAYSWLVVGAVVLGLVRLAVSRSDRRTVRLPDVVWPPLLFVTVSTCYLGMTFGCHVSGPVVQSNQLCLVRNITTDNLLPQTFAEHIEGGIPKAMFGDWHGSDRPPLQSGAVLVESPLTGSAGIRLSTYQILATLLQALWVPALWAVGRSLRLSGRRLGVLLTFCALSGFFLLNSVFVWPKLLAGSLTVAAFGLLYLERPGRARWLIAGLAAGGAYVSHSGVMFTLLPIAAGLCLPRFRPRDWRPLALLGAGAAVMVGPWLYYQTSYDPPGDRLAKWHLAGVLQVDDRSLAQALKDSYTDTPPPEIVRDKLENLAAVVGHEQVLPGYLYGATGFLARVRDVEFRSVLVALGGLNIGWVLLALRAGRRRLAGTGIDLQRLKVTGGMALLAVAVWTLMMFGPGTTIVHQGSYATMLLLFLVLGTALTALPRWTVRAVLALHGGYFAVVWVVSLLAGHTLSRGYLFWALAGAAGFALAIRALSRLPAVSERPEGREISEVIDLNLVRPGAVTGS